MKTSRVIVAAIGCVAVCGASRAEESVAGASGPPAAAPLAGDEMAEIVISTGYTKEKKQDVIGAVSAVDLSAVQDLPSGSVMQNLQGQIAGVQILTDGNPSAGTVVKIRGQGIGRLGFNAPLYIVDGVPLSSTTGLQELDPKSIESIQVLRDAASAAIYGARAANGVIVITTRRGAGKMALELSGSVSRDTFDYNVHPLSTQQRAMVWFQSAINSHNNPNNALYKFNWNGDFSNPVLNSVTIGQYTDAAGNRYIDPGLTQRVSDTNWFNAVTEQSKITDAHLSLSHAGDASRFYGAFSFHDAQGVVRNSEFKRLTLTLNSDHRSFSDTLTIGENFLLTNQLENAVNSNASFILNQAIETQSIIPIRTADGKNWGGPAAGTTDHRQPVEILTDTAGATSRLNKLLGSVYAEYRPFEALTLRASVGSDYSQKYYRNYVPGGTTGNVLLVDNLNTSYGFNRAIVFTDTADYRHMFAGRHDVDVLVGYENIDYTTENFFGAGSGLASPVDAYTFLNQATQNVTSGGGGDAWTLRSYFTKLSYDFEEKYLASFTLRRDGSSRFGANNRWGNFPSAAIGWRISQEPFFKLRFVDDLKLRLSDGTNGNQEIRTSAANTIYSPRYSTPSLFADFPCCQQETGTAYDLNGANTGTLPSGYAKTATGNPNLKWETSKQLNLGIDFTMFGNRLEGSIDFYRKRTSNILTTTVPLATAGEGAQQVVNGGTVDNKGWELELGYRTEFNFKRLGAPIRFRTTANLSHATNTVVSLPASVVNSFPGNGSDLTVLGRSINSLYGFLAGGIFQNPAEVAASGQKGAYVGGLRIVDVNHDGKIDSKDRVFFGSTDPDYIFGVNFGVSYRAWAFNMEWEGVQGGLAYNSWKNFTDFTANPGANWGGRVLGAWTPTNTGSSIPAVRQGYGILPDTYFYEDASYIKLRSVSIVYSVPDQLLSKIGVKHFRVYLLGQNLLTIKAHGTTMQDPETPGSGFPIPRRYTLGFQSTF